MIFHPTKLPGVFTIGIEPIADERGFFARSWCGKEFESMGLNPALVQCNISFNAHKGTLRGMHYQAAPCQEAKVVRCTSGSLYDVALDLRPDSPTFKDWVAVVLSAADRNMLYIPEGCAHGFLTLEDATEICYQMSEAYHPETARVYAGTIRHSRSPGRPASPSSLRGTRPIRILTKMSLLKELGPSKLTETGRDLHRFAAELYPICRSITGDGLRRTLASIQNRIPLEIREVPSGTPVFDWTVPKEWNVRDAYIRNSAGRKVVDFQLV